MPAVTSGEILVTGANGFVGLHTVRLLLEKGYTVRAAIRSEAKADLIRKVVPDAGDRVKFTYVSDMGADGAYDEAVKGVAGVVHTSSPIGLDESSDAEAYIGPAVKGVTGILESIEKHAPSVKRIVQVSSTVAVDEGFQPITCNESHWNDGAVDRVKRDGADASTYDKYSASKVYAERAMWDYFKTPRSFDAVSILPAFILGPAASGEVESMLAMIVPFLKPGIPESELEKPFQNIVDVREIAAAIVAALQVPQAGGERFIIAGEKLAHNDYALAAEKFPKAAGATKGNSDPAFRDKIAATTVKFDSARSQDVLGVSYRPKMETLHDAYASFIDKV